MAVQETIDASAVIMAENETETLASSGVLQYTDTENLAASGVILQQADTESLASSGVIVALAETETLASSGAIMKEGETENCVSSGLLVHEPVYTSVSPSDGALAGGTTITITGTDFTQTGNMAITIGGDACTSVVETSTTSLTCVTPAHIAGAYDIIMTNEYGTSNTGEDAFTYEYQGSWPAEAIPTDAASTSRTDKSLIQAIKQGWQTVYLAEDDSADWLSDKTKKSANIETSEECYIIVQELDPGASRTIQIEINTGDGDWLEMKDETGASVAVITFSTAQNGIIGTGDASANGIRPWPIMGKRLRFVRSGGFVSETYKLGIMHR